MEANPYREARQQKLARLKELGIEPWPRKAKRSHALAWLVDTYEDAGTWPNERLEAEGLRVSVMGRLISFREMGKSVFGHLTENGKKLQAFFRKNDLD
jgi:lysyl-tRNA synthetase class 2